MGFYGNMTNTAHTQFQFDRIYPNRTTMDKNIATDGIYVGRYVLVEYDQETNEALKKVYYINNEFYTSSAGTTQVEYNTFIEADDDEVNIHNFRQYYKKNGHFHYVADSYSSSTTYYKLNSGNATYGIEEDEVVAACGSDESYLGRYFRCTGDDGNGHATFVEITNEGDTDFLINYNIDILQYGMRNTKGAYSRAWDSTVWQKVFADGENRYIMIAELNSGAPAISVSFDRPSQNPLPPHVGGMTGENIYDIHLQQPWGFRVAAADNPEKSDALTTWVTTTYNEDDDTLNDISEIKNADIYYNKDGFNVETSNHDTTVQDSIFVRPSGKSGAIYANHKGYVAAYGVVKSGVTYYMYDDATEEYLQLSDLHVGDNLPTEVYVKQTSTPNDINELSIHLPSIGNSVASIYDFAYGVNPVTNSRTRDTEWKYVGDGPNPALGGMTRDLTTLSGTINTMHDALGMIIVKTEEPYTDTEIQRLDNDKIYYYASNNMYYYRTKDYSYTTPPYTFEKLDTSTDEYLFNYYYKLPKNTILTNELKEKFLSIEDEDIIQYRDIGGNGFDSDYDYYKRIVDLNNFNLYEDSVVDYIQDTFYYKADRNYLIEQLPGFSRNRQYYELKNEIDKKYQPTKDIKPLTVQKIYYFYDPTGTTEEEKYDAMGFLMEPDPDDTWEDLDCTYENGIVTDNVSGQQIYEGTEIIFEDSYETDKFYYYTPGSGGWEYRTSNYQGKNMLVDNTPLETDPKHLITLDSNYPQVDSRRYYNMTKTEINYRDIFFPSTFFWFENDDGTEDDLMALNAQAAQEWQDSHPYDGMAGFVQPYTIHSSAETNYVSPIEDRYYWVPKSLTSINTGQWVYDSIGNIIGWGFTFSGYQRVTNPIAWNGLFLDSDYEHTSRIFVHDITKIYYKIVTNNEEVYAQVTDLGTMNAIITANSNAEATGNELPYRLYIFEEESSYLGQQLYKQSTYYYYNVDNDIILDNDLRMTPGRQYYCYYENPESKILTCLEPVNMYEPGVYYYNLNGDVYQLDNNTVVSPGRDYYYRATVRVTKDLFNHFAIGSSWNPNINVVPCHLELGLPTIHYILKPLFGFLDNESTFFGLILALSQMLDKDNIITRENDTLRGIINNCIDLNEKFDSNVQPNKVLVTNNFGKITTSDVSIQSLINRIEALEACCVEIHNGGSSGGDSSGNDEPSSGDEEELNWLKFSSNSQFTLEAENGKVWDGTIEYSLDNGTTWTTWDGSEITVPANIQMRGTNNHYISTDGDPNNVSTWILNGYDFIDCTGKLGGLLNYSTVVNNNTVSTSGYAFYQMFANQEYLRTVPSFSNIGVQSYDYSSMFLNCTSLETLPILPTCGDYDTGCYRDMFKGCTQIKLSTTQTGEYTNAYTISATGSAAHRVTDMFTNTGGTFTGTPTVNTTYYTSNEIIS